MKQGNRPAIRLTCSLLAAVTAWATTQSAHAHGFTADVLDIKRLMTGKYRVIIWYTHLSLGEYRVAHIDYVKKEEAVAAFQKLVKGADFFLGDSQTIHFHENAEKPEPF